MGATARRTDTVGTVVVSAAWVMGLAVVSKSLGLFKDVVIASKFGTSAVMDSYLVASAIPLLIVGWARTPVRAGVVPLFTERLETDGEVKAWRAMGVVTSNLFVITVVATLLAILLAPMIVSGVAPGFGSESHDMATDLTRIMLAYVVFATLAAILTNILHCYRNFALPGIVLSVNNLVLIAAALFLVPRYGITGLAYGFVVGAAAQFLVQSPVLWRTAGRMRFRVNLNHPMFRTMGKLALPLFVGMAGAKLDSIVDRIFASMLSEGSISGLAYAIRLIDIPREILAVAFSTVLFPLFSSIAARKGYSELGDKLFLSIRVAFFLLLPVSVGMALLGDPLVRVIYQRGAFDEVSVIFTKLALVYYAPGIWAFGISTILTSAFMAMKNTKTPVVTGLVRLGVKIGLVFVFIGIMRHAGVALATSTSHIFKLVLLLILLPRELCRGRFLGMVRGFAGAAVATTVMGLVVRHARTLLLEPELPATLSAKIGALAAIGLIGLAVYLAAASLVARDELKATVSGIRSGVASALKKSIMGPPDDT